MQILEKWQQKQAERKRQCVDCNEVREALSGSKTRKLAVTMFKLNFSKCVSFKMLDENDICSYTSRLDEEESHDNVKKCNKLLVHSLKLHTLSILNPVF